MWPFKRKHYVFIRSKGSYSPHEWRQYEVYSVDPLIVRRSDYEFLFLLPDGRVDGSDEYEWRHDPAA